MAVRGLGAARAAVVKTPTKVAKTQKEMLRELGQTRTVENTPTSRSLLDKVKEMFS